MVEFALPARTLIDVATGETIVAMVAASLIGLVIGAISDVVTRLAASASDSPTIRDLHRRCHRPWAATLVAVALLLSMPSGDGRWTNRIQHGVGIVSIAAVAWLVVGILFVLEDAAFRRLRLDVANNLRNRRLRTQLDLVRRVTAVAITIVAVAAILLTFQPMRTFGASLLASAGLVGAIAGFAAQATLGNLFAGLQLAFSDALRIDDVVVVQDQWGRVEQMTLTYVVVHLWDERRLVLPTSYFTSTPFENWTRSESRVLGAVLLYLDATAPVDELRQVAHRFVESSPLWDRRDWVLQVVDMTERTIVIRVLASAADAPSSWDLRCDLREHLIRWLVEHYPEALPRDRVVVSDGRRGSDTSPLRVGETLDLRDPQRLLTDDGRSPLRMERPGG
ncbi:MAG: mechanosensitive ion channel family protein [Actinomycetales bacterium]